MPFMIFYLTEGRSLKRSRGERLQRNRRNLHKKDRKAMNVEVSASLRTNWKPENVRECHFSYLPFLFWKYWIFQNCGPRPKNLLYPAPPEGGGKDPFMVQDCDIYENSVYLPYYNCTTKCQENFRKLCYINCE